LPDDAAKRLYQAFVVTEFEDAVATEGGLIAVVRVGRADRSSALKRM
jgi:hypothetical protein